MTTNWMTTRIRNTTSPMTMFPPTTKLPKVLMICPALPWSRISRVEATLSERRKSVNKSSSDGNDENSIDSLDDSTITIVAMEIEMLQASSRSIRNVGSGIRSVASTTARPMAKTTSLCLSRRLRPEWA